MNVSENLNWEDGHEPTCSSSGSGCGKELIRSSSLLLAVSWSLTDTVRYSFSEKADEADHSPSKTSVGSYLSWFRRFVMESPG